MIQLNCTPKAVNWVRSQGSMHKNKETRYRGRSPVMSSKKNKKQSSSKDRSTGKKRTMKLIIDGCEVDSMSVALTDAEGKRQNTQSQPACSSEHSPANSAHPCERFRLRQHEHRREKSERHRAPTHLRAVATSSKPPKSPRSSASQVAW